MLDLVKLCLAPCCSCLQSPVVRDDMSYVFCTEEKLDRLESVMKGLMAKKQDIESKLDLPENRGKQPTHQLQHWVDQVGEKDKQVKKLRDEYSQGCCVRGPCCLNCVSRYSISKNAINLLAEITQLNGKQPEVSFLQLPPPKPVPESYKIVGGKISSNVDLSRSYLADETVSMIGIWGMGGVGKSTLLKKIKQALLNDADMGFNHVLFIEASKDIRMEKLREEIAKKLQLPSSASKEDIFSVLKISNFVLLLDNIWEEVDLIELGIRNPYNNDNSTKQHKVIFTTRSEDVCARMGAREMIKVECLEPDEAWGLFKDNLNNPDVIESDEKFKKIAWQVMEKCGGLPLALKVVGKAMSNKRTVQEWDYILTSLKNSTTKVVQGVEESLFPILKVSCDNLHHDIKKCFLSISVLQDKSKYELSVCWMGLGLIGDFVSIQKAYEDAEYILKILEESCLLYFSHDGYVCLHDVIYEMAMWIASDYRKNNNKWIVKKYDGLAEISTEEAENWRYANRVIIYGIKLLPVLSHKCSDLLCLMIKYSFGLEKIPKGFLGQMPNLIYLDLSWAIRINELPKDIKCLVNLQYLNISKTFISTLPKELVYLKKLQYLICRDMTELGKVEDGLISSLQKLKVIDLYPFGWVEPKELKILGKHIKAIGIRVVSEEVLQQLSCLPITQLYIRKLDSVTSLSFDILSCKNHGFLQQLNIRSCEQLEQIVMNGSETHLKYLEIFDAPKLQNIIWRDIRPPEFFHMLNRLHISNCNLDNLAWVLHLPCLFYLSIRDCVKIETLFYIKEESEIQQVSERPTFPALQFLAFGGLPKLVSISNYALDFPRLSWLEVGQCLNVKKLPFKRGINNSQKIDIDCEREWWERLEWDIDDAASPSQLSPYNYSTTFWPDD